MISKELMQMFHNQSLSPMKSSVNDVVCQQFSEECSFLLNRWKFAQAFNAIPLAQTVQFQQQNFEEIRINRLAEQNDANAWTSSNSTKYPSKAALLVNKRTQLAFSTEYSAHRRSDSFEIPKPKATKKIVLTSAQAYEIYRLRDHDCEEDRSSSSTASRSQRVAIRYDVDGKTVRDIWNRKTWVHATKNLWTPEEAEHFCRTTQQQQCKQQHNATSDTSSPTAAAGSLSSEEEADTVTTAPAVMSIAALCAPTADWSAQVNDLLDKRSRGRPKGRKDSRPRQVKSRSSAGSSCSSAASSAPSSPSLAAAAAAATAAMVGRPVALGMETL